MYALCTFAVVPVYMYPVLVMWSGSRVSNHHVLIIGVVKWFLGLHSTSTLHAYLLLGIIMVIVIYYYTVLAVLCVFIYTYMYVLNVAIYIYMLWSVFYNENTQKKKKSFLDNSFFFLLCT